MTNDYNFAKPESSENLLADIASWTDRLALLRGDNLYDLSRLFFASKGINTNQESLTTSIPHGMEQSERHEQLIKMVETTILKPAGLKFIRFIMGRLVCTEDSIVGALINPKSSVSKITYDLLGTENLVNYVAAAWKKEVTTEEVPNITRLSLTGNGEITTTIETIPLLPPVENPSVFYPYFEQSPSEVWGEFEKSKSNILLLVGPPGTGKSNFILEMMKAHGWDDRIHVADRHDVVNHPGLVDYIRGLPDGSVLVTEDSDQLVMKREDGNTNMSALLNATAGIVSRDVKLVISTNLESIQKVDAALTRPGRCFDILQFKMLNCEEAQNVRTMMRLPEVEIERDKMTLAEALNWHERRGGRLTQQKVGFAS